MMEKTYSFNEWSVHFVQAELSIGMRAGGNIGISAVDQNLEVGLLSERAKKGRE